MVKKNRTGHRILKETRRVDDFMEPINVTWDDMSCLNLGYNESTVKFLIKIAHGRLDFTSTVPCLVLLLG